MKKPTFEEIVAQAKLDPERFATAVLGQDPTYRSGSSVRYFDNQSLLVNISGPSAGRFNYFPDEDASGSLIDLILWHKGFANDKTGRREAIEIAKGILGLSEGKINPVTLPAPKTREELQKEQIEDENKRIKIAKWLWNMGSPSKGRDEGLAYLHNRGISYIPDSNTLRFRKMTRDDLAKMNIPQADIPKTPVTALIFASRTASGEIRAIQQILTTDGKKASVKTPKMTKGVISGSSVILGDTRASSTLLMCEGPETGASLLDATGIPTMIVLGKSNYTKPDIPEHITKLIIAADMEASGTGLASALLAAQKWKKRRPDMDVGIALPRLRDGDFNDVHRKHGPKTVAACITHSWFGGQRENDGTILVTPDARAAFHAWVKTTMEVGVKIPPRKDGKYQPMSIDSMVKPYHNRVLIVGNPAIQIRDDYLRNARPDLEIVTIHEDSRKFRELAKTEGDMQAFINASDMYAPKGIGEKEPVFFSLRRADADALDVEGYKTVAIRSRAVKRIDLGFMKNRRAIIAPLGEGTEHDRILTQRLEDAGANTLRLTWQAFKAEEGSPKIIRNEISRDYGAKDAAMEGWTGPALRDLIQISQVTQRQTKIGGRTDKEDVNERTAQDER